MDIFDNKILCKNCDISMKKSNIVRGGFIIRTLICSDCRYKIVHPEDKRNYNKFKSLKNKEFKVKMRIVGNSYAVSIPKEIIHLMNQKEKEMSEMVRLCFEDFGKLSLTFNKIRGKYKNE